MKQIYLQRLLKLTALILPILLLILILQNHIFRFEDGNTERLEKFYLEEEDSLDVVLMGASEVHNGYSPGYAYDKYGYTSYMYSLDGNVGSLYTAQLNEILAHQDPGLIFVDIFGFIRSETPKNQETQLRKFTESIPNSLNKWNAIMDFDYDHKASLFFPFIKYHGDFNLAKTNLVYLLRYHDFIDGPSLLKGMCTHTDMYSGVGEDVIANSFNSHISDQSEDFLLDLLQYCQQEELDNVVFVNFPRYVENDANNDLLAKVEHIQQIIEEYGYDFLDLQEEKVDMGLKAPMDFYSPHHLNARGQKKLTEYLGNLAINHYHLIPRTQSKENEEHWQKCADLADEYFDITHEQIAAEKEIFIGTDTDILPYLDDDAIELVEEIQEEYGAEQPPF